MIPKSSKSKELYLFRTVDCAPSSVSHQSPGSFDLEDGLQPSFPVAASSNRATGLQITTVGELSRPDVAKLKSGDDSLTVDVTEPTLVTQYGEETQRRFRIQYANDSNTTWNEIDPSWSGPVGYNLDALSWHDLNPDDPELAEDTNSGNNKYAFDNKPTIVVDKSGYMYAFLIGRLTRPGYENKWRILCARAHQKDGYFISFSTYAYSPRTDDPSLGSHINGIIYEPSPGVYTRLTVSGCLHGGIPYVALIDGGGYSNKSAAAHLFYLNTKSDGEHPRILFVKEDFTGFRGWKDQASVQTIAFTHGAKLLSAGGKMFCFIGVGNTTGGNKDYGVYIFETRDTTSWSLEQTAPGPTGSRLGGDDTFLTLENDEVITAIDELNGLSVAVTNKGGVWVRQSPSGDWTFQSNPCSRNEHPLWSVKIVTNQTGVDASSGVVYAGGDWDIIIRSDDYGGSWKVVSMGALTTYGDNSDNTYTDIDGDIVSQDGFYITPLTDLRGRPTEQRSHFREWTDYTFDDFYFNANPATNVAWIRYRSKAGASDEYKRKSLFTTGSGNNTALYGSGYGRPPRIIKILSAPVASDTGGTLNPVWFVTEDSVWYLSNGTYADAGLIETRLAGTITSHPCYLSKRYRQHHRGDKDYWYIYPSIASERKTQINDAIIRMESIGEDGNFEKEDDIELILCGIFDDEEDTDINQTVDLATLLSKKGNGDIAAYERVDGFYPRHTTLRLINPTSLMTKESLRTITNGCYFGTTSINREPYNAVAIFSANGYPTNRQEDIWVAGPHGQLDLLTPDFSPKNNPAFPLKEDPTTRYWDNMPDKRDVIFQRYDIPNLSSDGPIRDLVVAPVDSTTVSFYLTDATGRYHFAYLDLDNHQPDDKSGSSPALIWHSHRFLDPGTAPGYGVWAPLHVVIKTVDTVLVTEEVLAGLNQYLYSLSEITSVVHPDAAVLSDDSIVVVAADTVREKVLVLYTRNGVNPNGDTAFTELSLQKYKADPEQEDEGYLRLGLTIPDDIDGNEDSISYPRVIAGTDGRIYIFGHAGLGLDNNYAAVSLVNRAPLDSWVDGSSKHLDIPAINIISDWDCECLEYRYGRFLHINNSGGNGLVLRTSRTWKPYSDTSRAPYEPTIRQSRYDLGVADVGIIWLGEPEKTDKYYITTQAQFGIDQLAKESPSFFWSTGDYQNVSGGITLTWDRSKLTETLGEGNMFCVNACALFGTNFPYARWAITVPSYTGDGWPTDRRLWNEFSMTSILDQGVTAPSLSQSSSSGEWASFFRDTTKSWTSNQWASGAQSYYLFVSVDGAGLGPNVSPTSVAIRKIVSNSPTTLHYAGEPIEFNTSNPFIEYAIFTDRFFNDGRHGTLAINSLVDQIDYGNPTPTLADTEYEYGKLVRLTIPTLLPTDTGQTKIGTAIFGKCIPVSVRVEGDFVTRHKYSIGWRWAMQQPIYKQTTPSGISFIDHIGSASTSFSLSYDNIEQWEADVFYSMLIPNIYKAFALCFDGETINSVKLVRLASEPQVTHVGGSLFSHGVTLEEVR